MQTKNNLAYLLLILASLFWSGNFIVGKAASIFEIPPFSLNFYRWLFAWLILLPFTYKELINQELQVMDMTAVTLCKDNNLPIIVFDIKNDDSLNKLINYKFAGTFVY